MVRGVAFRCGESFRRQHYGMTIVIVIIAVFTGRIEKEAKKHH